MAQVAPTILRLSMDAKATVLIGTYSRGGKNRILVKAADHDFKPVDKVTPYCIFLPDHQRAYLYFACSRVTSDFIADCLLDCWQQIREDFPEVQTPLLHQDNGPENHSRRTQFIGSAHATGNAPTCRINSRTFHSPQSRPSTMRPSSSR